MGVLGFVLPNFFLDLSYLIFSPIKLDNDIVIRWATIFNRLNIYRTSTVLNEMCEQIMEGLSI